MSLLSDVSIILSSLPNRSDVSDDVIVEAVPLRFVRAEAAEDDDIALSSSSAIMLSIIMRCCRAALHSCGLKYFEATANHYPTAHEERGDNMSLEFARSIRLVEITLL